jgi:uncharacterized protein (TIGR00297 family)
MLKQLLLGLLLGSLIAYLAYRTHALTSRGAWTAALLGTIIFGLGGLPWAVLLLAFFISSSLLSRLSRRRKAALDEKFSKGSQRDAAQVLANGGIAGLLVIVQWILSHSNAAGWDAGPPIWLGYAASLAAANADTWATELGVLSRRAPVSIVTGKTVERGTSGGVSLLGLVAALAGAALVAILACGMALLEWTPGGSTTAWLAFFLVSGAGLAGSLVDSLLGATVQAIYDCPACRKETERHPTHSCGAATVLKRGWSWFDNDWVNTTCTLVGAILAIGIAAGTIPMARMAQPPASSSLLEETASGPSKEGTAMTIQLSSTAFPPGGRRRHSKS